MKLVYLGFFLAMAVGLAQQGWYPHEGGLLKYRVQIRFGEEPDTMPDGWKFGRVSAVAVDPAGNVYVFHRGNKADPIVVFSPQGQYLRSWGKGLFANPHGIRIDRQNHVWVTDTNLHMVMEFTSEGQLLRSWGVKGKAGATPDTFNRPTDVAFLPSGDFFVTDGYGNSRVVKFSREGKYLMEWGKRGTGPGEFDLPHAIVIDSRQNLYVSDRENNRIQIFDANGTFLRQWTHLGATQGMDINSRDELWIVTHRNKEENIAYDTLAGRIMRIDAATGRILGAMESPGHWLALAPGPEIYIGSLTGNVFKWYPGWSAGLREQAPGVVAK
ncbi:MAG: 6-bladed beta-propeller [Bryobacterales bacterium]|nr:6-bladed beta-propeller [Bryobacterales bacterium]